nr:MAG TPA: hypothetical protein [Caudoviricetes sp.]
MKKSNGGLNGSPKGRREPLRAVRPILFSSPPMIGLCGGEFKKLISKGNPNDKFKSCYRI